MADKTVSDLVPFVNENNMIHIDFLNEQTPIVSSLDISVHFEKRHDSVLREIDRICTQLPEIFIKHNFVESKRGVDAPFGKKKQRFYLLTRDAFSLLVMGFTGSAALQWKLRYIEAFNALERGIRANIRTDALEEAKRLPPSEQLLKQERLSGILEGQKLQKRRDGLRQLMRIRAYREKGLTQAEIGRILGISRDAVKRRMMRAREMGVAI